MSKQQRLDRGYMQSVYIASQTESMAIQRSKRWLNLYSKRNAKIRVSHKPMLNQRHLRCLLMVRCETFMIKFMFNRPKVFVIIF